MQVRGEKLWRSERATENESENKVAMWVCSFHRNFIVFAPSCCLSLEREISSFKSAFSTAYRVTFS